MDWFVQDIADLLPGALWRRKPAASLCVESASIHAPTYRANNMVFVRAVDGIFGMAADPGMIVLKVLGKVVRVPLIGAGQHSVENAMAIAAALCALDVPVGPLMDRLRYFHPLAGRGPLLNIPLADGSARILDHSYNANPASMRAALDELAGLPCTGRRIALLGQMAELGDDSAAQHRKLLNDLISDPLDQIFLLGDEFANQIDTVRDDPRFILLDRHDNGSGLEKLLMPNDLMMVKGSNCTGLYRMMAPLRKL